MSSALEARDETTITGADEGQMVQEKRGVGPYLTYLAVSGVLNLPRLLPYKMRLNVVGALAQHVIGPVAGYNKRVRNNLALTRPDIPEQEREVLVGNVLRNTGRFLAEMWSGKDLYQRCADIPLEGPGLEALNAAKEAGRPIIGVTGHYGNYDAARTALIEAGFDLGGLYRPMSNAYFNAAYKAKMEGFGGKAFEQSRRGMAQMVKHLRGGGLIAILIDQREDQGAELRFFDKPALTTLAIAEMALKYDALFLPIFATRQENGLDFDVIVETPIAHSDARTMMQEYNDRLEAQIRSHMDQYFWIHNRWKMPEDK